MARNGEMFRMGEMHVVRGSKDSRYNNTQGFPVLSTKKNNRGGTPK